ncbi:amino acid adenylation domain-containing protein [Roseiflexus sp.]|uniref:amino acid adenylation domain-containing protein n=1 Tax=Roseiflexus sp. TaxID=2562120 RepID=UPI00398B19E7
MSAIADTRNIEAIYPLSPIQQGLLFHSLYAPNSGVYVEQLVCTLHADVDVSAFSRAWERVVQRHAPLRTAFAWKSQDQPLQVVHRAVELPLVQEDWRAVSPDEQEQRLERWLADERTRGFDVAKAPLMRLALLRFADDAWRFVWTHHHLLLDGWSLPLVLQEVFAAYEAYRIGGEPSLPPVRPYRDYIAWLRKQDQAAAETYWRAALAGFTAPATLVVDRLPVAPHSRSPGVATCSIALSAETTRALTALAHRVAITLGTVLQGAWALLLSRYSGETDVAFGVTTSGRPAELPGIEKLVGLCINTLPVRVQVDEDMPIDEWLARLRDLQTGLHQYWYAPLPSIQQWSDVAPGLPLFESILVFENYPFDAQIHDQLHRFGVSDVYTFSMTNYPLTVVAVPGRELKLTVSYDQERFDTATIERMLGHLRMILEGFTSDAYERIADIPLLTETETMRFVDWNATTAPFPDDVAVHRLFEAQARSVPQVIAVEDGIEQVAYADLDARANALAWRLRAVDVGRNTIVAICTRRSVDQIVATLAVLKAGGAYLPLDPKYPPARLSLMLRDAQPAALLTQRALLDRVTVANDAHIPLILLDDLAQDGDATPLDGGATATDLAYVIYTSGSTGAPKGVAIAHRGLCNFTGAQSRDFGIGVGSRVLQFASFSFDASAAEIFSALVSGATLVLMPDNAVISADELATLLRHMHISHVTLPPSLLAVLPDDNLPDLRVVAAAGERCPLAVAARWRQERTFFNAYGPTETTIGPCWHAVTPDDLATGCVPIGKPIPNVQAYVLDARLRPVPIGVPGELWVGGVGLARGYLNRPELTAERFVDVETLQGQQRLYRTGDRVRWLPSGVLEYLGRLDEQVKVRGFRIEPGEIVAMLRMHPGVRDAAVVAHEESGEVRLIAYVVADGDVVGEVHTMLAERLPAYMVPSAFVRLDALPLTPNGKLDKAALPAPAFDVPVARVDVPHTPEEQLLAAVWSQVLHIPQVGRSENFFALGGHSLSAMRMIARIREIFRVELPIRDLFEAPTIAGLAERIVRARRGSAGVAFAPLVPQPRTSVLPASYAQQRLWFLERLAPERALYNLPAALRLRGRLDVAALQASFDAIVARHEVLRTRLVAVDGAPMQQIDPPAPLPLPLTDLSDRDAVQQDEEVRRIVVAEAQTPFDLARAPLLRARLIRLADDDYMLLIVVHHSVADGWSVGIFVNELGRLYAAAIEGQQPVLPDLAIQYADYAAWQRTWLAAGDNGAESPLQRQLAYWRNRLADAPPLLDLPTDRPRMPVQSAHGGRRGMALSADLTGRLRVLAHNEGATLFMALVAGFAALLGRYSGVDDLCIGTPVAGRSHPALEPLIGFFVNTLVLRIDLAGSPSFRELLRRVRGTALEAYASQDVPFEMVVDTVQPERDLSHTPLFQVMLALNNVHTPQIRLPGLEIEPCPVESGLAHFDLTLDLRETEDTIEGALEYNADLFDAATIDRLIGHFQQLLTAAVNDPDRPADRLPLMSEVEQRRILVEWNAPVRPIPACCFHHLVADHAARHPNAPAAVFGDATLTYGELDARATRLAGLLRRSGIGRDTLVGLCVERSLDLVIASLAVLKAGGAFLPLDPRYPIERLRFMVQDACPKVLIRHATVDVSAWGKLPGDLTMIVLDGDQMLDIAEDPPSVDDEATPGDLAYAIYTSGSTGLPKAALLTHRGLVNLALWQRETFGLAPGWRVLQFSALSFDAAIWEMAMALGSGATLVLASHETLASPPELHRLLQRQRVTIATIPPSVLAVVREDDLPDLRVLIAAGEACSAELVARWAPGRTFVNAYGPTETTVCATAGVCDPADTRPPSIGRPLTNVPVYILDRSMQPTPPGVAGELYIGGLGVARGYLNRPELTAERFVTLPPGVFGDGMPSEAQRLYRTGDRVCWRADGTIRFLGRFDDQVKLRGFRIEPGEIEAAVCRHAQVRDALALVREIAGDQRLLLYLIPEGEAPSAFELRSFLAGQLPEYMIPAAFVALEAWPLTPGGKVDRRALPVPIIVAGDEEYVAPRTATEQEIADLCASLLGVERVSVTASFFALGGHSLLATQLLARVQARWGVEVPLRNLFEQPTVEALAAMVDRMAGTDQDTMRIAALLEQVEGLSDEEVLHLLEKAAQGERV